MTTKLSNLILLLCLSLSGCCVQKPVKAHKQLPQMLDHRPDYVLPEDAPGPPTGDMKADYIGCCVVCVEKDDTYCPER